MYTVLTDIGIISQYQDTDFNPLAPRGARPVRYVFFNTGLEIFQSTRPSRGETRVM